MKILTAILILASLSIIVKGLMNKGIINLNSQPELISTQTLPEVNRSTKPALFDNQTPSASARHSSPITHTVKTNIQFRCDGRQYCSEMSSKEEAVYFLTNCPNVKMDGDNDGDPCEKQFGRGNRY